MRPVPATLTGPAAARKARRAARQAEAMRLAQAALLSSGALGLALMLLAALTR